MTYAIRPIEPNDLPRFVDLCHSHALFERADYYRIGKEEKLKRLLFSDSPVLYSLVVVVENELVGYVSYTFDYSTWDAQVFLYMDCLYLEPEFRSQGIGELLFVRLKNIAKSKDCLNIQWQTPVFNEKAIKFYKRIGATSKDKLRFNFLL